MYKSFKVELRLVCGVARLNKKSLKIGKKVWKSSFTVLPDFQKGTSFKEISGGDPRFFPQKKTRRYIWRTAEPI